MLSTPDRQWSDDELLAEAKRRQSVLASRAAAVRPRAEAECDADADNLVAALAAIDEADGIIRPLDHREYSRYRMRRALRRVRGLPAL